ncbi:MAG TPA: RHS repeat-associated core domain-containing protein, partial [Pyrinomonadaceae bacterium]
VTKSKRVTDMFGAVVSTIELDPWGADTNRSSNGAFQPKKFTSYERDANGTDEAMFRRYNRWQSRFDQPDPYDGSYDLGDPQSFNRYAYVQGDPVNFVDPSGLFMDCPPDTGSVIHVCHEEPGGLPGSGPADHSGIRPPHDRPGGGGGLGGGTGAVLSAVQGRRFGRKDKEARCKDAINEATRAMSEIDRRMGNAISAPGGLDAGHQKAIAQDIGRLKSALEAIEKNCFDGSGGPPLLPELADSLNELRQKASQKLKVPPVGWDGGRTAAENRIKAAAFGANVGSVLLRVIQWLQYAVAF